MLAEYTFNCMLHPTNSICMKVTATLNPESLFTASQIFDSMRFINAFMREIFHGFKL